MLAKKIGIVNLSVALKRKAEIVPGISYTGRFAV
jgi:hypothetical protein